ncbi:GNAT family N-acetyltransferase [Treponema phagedenis]|uniref:GNAT family N-acetyltransferase n=1 Tax=Treponema phagedenis TaxID=162 RepID=UPI00209009EC|nr:GNAT family N-acetyltransferase [Treponema phagedenis]
MQPIAKGKQSQRLLFPIFPKGKVMIDHTFVDSSLRGQGIADKLIREVIAVATKQNKKIEPVCSYAKTWFENNPDYKNICTE